MDNIQTQPSSSSEDNHQEVVLKDWLFMCLSRWYWFLISVVLLLAGATFYILRTVPVYQRTAKVLIKDDKNAGSIGGDVSDISSLGLLRSSVNVNNELIALQSMDIMNETVRRLHLDVNYSEDGFFRPTILYGESLPVTVDFVGIPDDQSATLLLKLNGNDSP